MLLGKLAGEKRETKRVTSPRNPLDSKEEEIGVVPARRGLGCRMSKGAVAWQREGGCKGRGEGSLDVGLRLPSGGGREKELKC